MSTARKRSALSSKKVDGGIDYELAPQPNNPKPTRREEMGWPMLWIGATVWVCKQKTKSGQRPLTTRTQMHNLSLVTNTNMHTPRCHYGLSTGPIESRSLCVVAELSVTPNSHNSYNTTPISIHKTRDNKCRTTGINQ